MLFVFSAIRDRCRHAHHLVRHAVGFMLVLIIRLADGEFRLQNTSDGAVANGALQKMNVRGRCWKIGGRKTGA
ncbi:MAG: hypothetical protein AAB354_10825 [candidate division KSB1 bacterium]